jgi:integrase/recombinase XerD
LGDSGRFAEGFLPKRSTLHLAPIMGKPFSKPTSAPQRGLEHFYLERRTLTDFRRGPLGPHFDGFAEALKNKGYSPRTASARLGIGCQFNVFLMERGIATLADVSEALIEPFLDLYLVDIRTASERYSPRVNAHSHLRSLFRFLVDTKALIVPPPTPIIKPYSWILDPYLQHLRDDHEMRPKSIAQIAGHLASFLETLPGRGKRRRFHALPPEAVEAHIKRHLKDSPYNLQRLSSSLRRFFRYCALHRFTSGDLSGLIPPVRYYRHASLPKGADDSAVRRFLGTINRDAPVGARDYAIAILIAAYGIRGVSAAQLLLDDIDWQRSRIRFRAQKGGKEVIVPLLEPVGEAIIQWLRHRYSHSPFREVFLGVGAPHRPLTGGAISYLIHRSMAKAGFAPGTGAQTLRHSWAIRALAHDSPIKAIADVLGHRYIDTTFIYAKVDFKTLREVALPWPQIR